MVDEKITFDGSNFVTYKAVDYTIGLSDIITDEISEEIQKSKREITRKIRKYKWKHPKRR